jgi:hypothetical protein
MSVSRVRKAAELLLLAVVLIVPAAIAQAASFRTETRVFDGTTWLAKAILDFEGAGYGVIAADYQAPPKLHSACVFQVFIAKGQTRAAEEVTSFTGALGLELDLFLPAGADLYASLKDQKGNITWVKVWDGSKGTASFPPGYDVKYLDQAKDGSIRFQIRAWPSGDPCFAW